MSNYPLVSSAPLKKKKAYHHGNLRSVLIQAGLDLIAENGVRAFTLREIGARVGVSRMAAYRHFTGKAQFLAAIREAGFEKFAEALQAGRDHVVCPQLRSPHERDGRCLCSLRP